MRKLVIIVNVDWFFLSHRLPIALEAMRQGYEVTIVSKDTGRKEEIESHGLHFVQIPFKRAGSNPFHELYCLYRLIRIYLSMKPDLIHLITLKTALLGALAAKLTHRKNLVIAISGFGYNFTNGRDGLTQKLLKRVMKTAFKSKYFQYIFQNPDDKQLFLALGFTEEKQTHLIKGSGVDLNRVTYTKELPKKLIEVVLPARMLYDKGVIEFIAAASQLKSKVLGRARFLLAGDSDQDNPSGIPLPLLQSKLDSGYIDWVGFKKDIFSILKESAIVVLPSYREGLPKSLIDACAVGRPIITTDTEGCRECVEEGVNGYLVPVKDTEILSKKIYSLIEDPELREQMGLSGRRLAEKEFSIESVIEKHLTIYALVLRKNTVSNSLT